MRIETAKVRTDVRTVEADHDEQHCSDEDGGDITTANRADEQVRCSGRDERAQTDAVDTHALPPSMVQYTK